MFYGRRKEFAWLDERLQRCRQGHGQLVVVRGRRQVGKSALIDEFTRRSGHRVVYFQAVQGASAVEQTADFHALINDIIVDDAISIEAAIRELSTADDQPLIVVLDEFPWLISSIPSIEGSIQRLWDRVVQTRPIMIVLVGSDLRMMEALHAYDRPLYGRGEVLALAPFSPSEVGEAAKLTADDALSSYVVTGGFPRLVLDRGDAESLEQFLNRSLADSASRLVVNGERVVVAEFPEPGAARAVLRAIGAGQREHKAIAGLTGLSASALQRALELLIDKQVVERREPYSTTHRGRTTRYSVAESALRFWLRWIAPSLPRIERGRGDLVAATVVEQFETFRGTAIEPIVREALLRMDPARLPGLVEAIGSYWTRDGSTEVDLVGGDKSPVADSLAFVGSIKWRARRPFDDRDLADLIAQRARVPGADATTRLMAVSRTGFTASHPDLTVIGPEELVAAW